MKADRLVSCHVDYDDAIDAAWYFNCLAHRLELIRDDLPQAARKIRRARYQVIRLLATARLLECHDPGDPIFIFDEA